MSLPEERYSLRIPYRYDYEAVSIHTGLEFDPDQDVTVQSYGDEVDINSIVDRFGLSGTLPIPRELGEFGDFSDVQDFQTAMEQLRRGEEAFMGLPASIRERFRNDPVLLWRYLQESDNVEEAVKLGILNEGALRAAEPPSKASDGVQAPPPPVDGA